MSRRPGFRFRCRGDRLPQRRDSLIESRPITAATKAVQRTGSLVSPAPGIMFPTNSPLPTFLHFQPDTYHNGTIKLCGEVRVNISEIPPFLHYNVEPIGRT